MPFSKATRTGRPLIILADRSLVGPSLASVRQHVVLPRLPYHRFAGALRPSGGFPQEEADRLSLRAGQSLTVLHRCLAREPALPAWARGADPILMALLLAGALQAGQEGTRR